MLQQGKSLSGGQEALDRLAPLSARDIIGGDFIGPGTRQVPRWAHQEGDLLPWVRCPNLLVEFERLCGGVSANVEHHEIVYMGLPQKSCGGNLFSFMHLDSVSSQDGSAYLTRSLKAVDEKNFLVGKSRVTTKWWAVHRTPPKRARPF